MASRYEVEVTVISGKNLKNVNWRDGDLHPYVVLWVDPAAKSSTKVAVDGGEGSGEDPFWDEKLTIPVPPGGSLSADGVALSVDVVHANAGKDTKPLVGSATVPLAEIVDEVGIGGKASRTLKLKRPSGRPQGRLEVKIAVREPSRYYDAPPPPAYGAYAPPAYGYQHRDYGGAPPPYGYGAPYGAPPPSGYPSYGYPYGAAPPPPAGYGQPSAYGQQPYAVSGGEKKSKFGMGTGLAVGAAAGVLGGLALAEGADYVEDKIADDVTDRVEDDLGFDDGGDF